MREKLTDADLLLGLANDKGLQGVRETDMNELLSLDGEALRELAQKLEAFVKRYPGRLS